MKYLYSLLLCLVCAFSASGQTIIYNGVSYSQNWDDSRTVSFAGAKGVKGDFTVPTSVTFPEIGEVEYARWETVSGPEWTNSDGVYSSGAMDRVGSTVIRCTFKARNAIAFDCSTQSGYTYNYITIGALDEPCTSENYKETLMGYNWNTRTVLYSINDTEEHFVEICFTKNDKSDEEGHARVSLGSVNVSGQYTVSRIEGTNLFEYNKDITSVTIPESFTDFTSIPWGCFMVCTSLKCVNLPKNINSISGSAFSGCSALEDIDLPNVETIGEYAFSGCSKLTSISFPKVTTIPSSCFNYCSSLKEINMPNVNKLQSAAFSNCSSLTKVYFPLVTKIPERCFSGCSSLAEIDVSNVICIDNEAFYACSNISKLRIKSLSQWLSIQFGDEGYSPSACPLYNTNQPVDLYIGSSTEPTTVLEDANITEIPDYAFRNCAGITNISFPKVTSIGREAFTGCSSLANITLPLANSIGIYAFSHCSSLMNVNLPEAVSIDDYAFGGCSSLTNVDLPEAVSIDDYAFGGCSSLKSVSIPKVKTIGSNAFGRIESYIDNNWVYKSCDKLESIDLSSVERIGDAAFRGCTNINSLRIGSIEQWCNVSFEVNQHSNGGTNPLQATNQVVDLYIGDSEEPVTKLIDSNVKNVPDYAFYNCKGITKVSFPEAIVVNGYAFKYCSALTDIDFPKATSIGYQAFQECTSLISIDLPKVTSIGDYAFYACTSLENVSIPEAVTIGNYVFAGYCQYHYNDNGNYIGSSYYINKIENLDMPEVKAIGDEAFYYCQNLTSISIPNVEEIGRRAFYETKISSVRVSSADQWCNINYPVLNDEWERSCTYPFGVNGTNYLYIGDSETPATEITLTANVAKIPYYAFRNTNIHTIHFEGTTPPILEDLNAINEWTMLAVPEEAYETYLAAEKYREIPLQITIDGQNTIELADVEANEKTSIIQKLIGEKNLGKVINLTVSGTINSYDMMIIRNKMTSLRNLDLTNARIVDCDYEYYTGYHSENDVVGPYWFTSTKLMNVKLPSTAKVIGAGLFKNVISLANVQIPDGITTIGSEAFYGCGRTDNLRIPKGITSLGQGAFNNCRKFQNVVIPSSLTYIPYNAFGNYIIEDVTIPSSIESIDSYAFGPINNLHIPDLESWLNMGLYDGGTWGFPTVQNVYFGESETPSEIIVVPDGVKEINHNAFSGFEGVKKVVLPESLETIGSAAFARSGITEIALPEKINNIQDYTFYGCNALASVEFDDNIKSIGYEAFRDCNSLKEVELSPFIETIGGYAFYGCSSLEEVLVPAGIQVIHDYAFDNCPKLSKVIATTVEPISIIQETFGAVYKTADVYAPKTSYDNYYWDTQWSQFLSVKEYDEYYGDSYKYKYFYLKGDFKLDKFKGRIQGCPKADFHDHCGLIVTGDEMQELDEICLKHTGLDGASIIGHGNIHAKKVVVEIDVKGNKWHFFYFPVNIDMRDVKYAGSSVWYYYDGEARAENGNGGWKKVTGGKLEAGRGYIFQGSMDGKLFVGLNEQTFRGDDKRMQLKSHVAQKKNDASWNLIGNPFISYYGIETLDYHAPITIYNNETGNYETIRQGDDHYDFHPFQAFFVQKPEMQNTMDFAAANRETKTQKDKKNAQRIAAKKNEVVADSPRKIINLSVVQDSLSDRTRIVVNPEKSVSYELDCDAAKFIADNMPQIYTVDGDGAMYSINERCLGNGMVNLVVKATKEGVCTISASRLDCSAILRDMETGTEVDLSKEDYTFLTEAKTYTNRFVVLLSENATGIDDTETLDEYVSVEDGCIVIAGTDKDVKVYNLSGALVASQKGSCTMAVGTGSYVVKIGGKGMKVVVNN